VQAVLLEGIQAPVSLLDVPNSVKAITPLVGQLLVDISTAHQRGEAVEVFVFHNHPKAGAIYEPFSKRLLPLDRAWQAKLTSLAWPTRSLPDIIDGTEAALDAFIRGYLFVLLFQACAESLNSENASRLAAMQRAEKNIKHMLDDLNGQFHRIRQEGIDEEMFDVISDFEALTSHRSAPKRTQ
jgi:F-type H+-transporting ATPase subunit gamma